MKKGKTIIKIGLKENAVFLFKQMDSDTSGGSTGGVYWNKIMHVTEEQFERFKKTLIAFGGDLEKSLTKTEEHGFYDEVDYDCYFVKAG